MRNAVEPVILCGGAGLRLRSVTGGTPKSLAYIGQRPFLEILINQLRRHGFDRVVLAVGYQKESIREHFGDRALGLQIDYSIEETPLGTGGALRKATDLLDSDAALIMNGDSYTDVNLSSFIQEHQSSKVDLSVVVVPADGREDCGLVSVAADGSVLGFKEKQSLDGKKNVNAGIYLASKKLLGEVPLNLPVSLEVELFPKWLGEGIKLRAFYHPGTCIDIGTPERYKTAQDSLARVELGEALADFQGQQNS